MFEAHHDGSEVYLSDPNPDLGATTTAFVRVPTAADVTEVHVRTVMDGEPLVTPARIDRTSPTETWWRADVLAHNPVASYRFHLRDGVSRTSWLNQSGQHAWEVPDAHDFKLTTEHHPPEWVHNTAWYQVFPDRFSRRPDGKFEAPLPSWATAREWSDPVRPAMPGAMTDLWGGSLAGVERRLDYLAELGVNGIYSCPFYPARSNHRYDASTFDHVDPLLGGDEALRSLTEAAARRGMRVMGDLTTNHSGDEHEWFLSAVADPSSPTRDFYLFNDDGTYASWLGIDSLPKFNHRNAAFRRRFYEGPESIAGRYLSEEFGLGALRIDVANMTGRDGAIDDNRRCSAELRATINEVRPDAWLLAEHNHDATGDLDGGGWHGTMNYAGFTRPVWTWLRRDDVDVQAFGEPGPLPLRSGPEMVRSARAFAAQMPFSVQLTNMNLLGSHDSARWAFASGSPETQLLGAVLLCTMPGSPSVFYGDEIGLGSTATLDRTARAPFPWQDTSSWNGTLLQGYRELLHLRTSSSALAAGGLRWLDVGPDHLIYLRESRSERLLVHVARASHAEVALPLDLLGATDASPVAGEDVRVDSSLHLAASAPTWSIVELG